MNECRTCGDVPREASKATGRHIWPHGSDSLRCDGCGKMFVSVERMQQQRAAGIAQGRKLEREAVVAWLRDRANTEPFPTELAHASDAIEAGERVRREKPCTKTKDPKMKPTTLEEKISRIRTITESHRAVAADEAVAKWVRSVNTMRADTLDVVLDILTDAPPPASDAMPSAEAP